MTFLAGLEKDLTFDACITADDELAVGAVKYALSQGKKDSHRISGDRL